MMRKGVPVMGAPFWLFDRVFRVFRVLRVLKVFKDSKDPKDSIRRSYAKPVSCRMPMGWSLLNTRKFDNQNQE